MNYNNKFYFVEHSFNHNYDIYLSDCNNDIIELIKLHLNIDVFKSDETYFRYFMFNLNVNEVLKIKVVLSTLKYKQKTNYKRNFNEYLYETDTIYEDF